MSINKTLQNCFSPKKILVLWKYANGYELEFSPDQTIQNKGYGNSITIRYDIIDVEITKHYILSLTEIVTTRIKADYTMLRAMDSTIDSIRGRYGFDSVKRACFTNAQ